VICSKKVVQAGLPESEPVSPFLFTCICPAVKSFWADQDKKRSKKMTTVNCVECDGEVELAENVIVGEIVECPDCGVELEVTGVSPLTIELAPEVEEDWGE